MEEGVIDSIVGAIDLDAGEHLAHKAKEYLRLSQVRRASQFLGALSPMLPHVCVELAGDLYGLDCEDKLVLGYNLNRRRFRSCTRNLASILRIERRKSSLLSLCVGFGVVEIYDDLKRAFELSKLKYEAAHPEVRSWEPGVWDEPEVASAFIYAALRPRKFNITKQAVISSAGNRSLVEKWIAIFTELCSGEDFEDISKKAAAASPQGSPSHDSSGRALPSYPGTPGRSNPGYAPGVYFLGEFSRAASLPCGEWKASVLELAGSAAPSLEFLASETISVPRR